MPQDPYENLIKSQTVRPQAKQPDPYESLIKQQGKPARPTVQITPRSLAGTTVTPMRPRAATLTTNDTAWHFGMTPRETRQLTPEAFRVLQEGVANDAAKKAAGQSIYRPPLKYQNEMRRKAGLKPLEYNVKTDDITPALYYKPEEGALPINPKSITVRPRSFDFKSPPDERVKAGIREQITNEYARDYGEPRLLEGRSREAEIKTETDKRFAEYQRVKAYQANMSQRGPAFEARASGKGERLANNVNDFLAKYAPGAASLDTPMGIKTDVVRGLVSGGTLGATDIVLPKRGITPEEKIINPNAEIEAAANRGLGEAVGSLAPLLVTGGLLSGVEMPAAVHTAATFGLTEAGRQGINVLEGRPADVSAPLWSASMGLVMGGLAGKNPGVIRRSLAFVTPQLAVDLGKGAKPEDAAKNALTNLAFALTSGGENQKLKGVVSERTNLPSEQRQRSIPVGESGRLSDAGLRANQPNVLPDRAQPIAPTETQIAPSLSKGNIGETKPPLREAPANLESGEVADVASDEPVVHHSQLQSRRVRNTEHGDRGEFKSGKVEQPPEKGEQQSATPDSLATAAEPQPVPTKAQEGVGQPAPVPAEIESAKEPWQMSQREFSQPSDSYNEMRGALGSGESYPAVGDYSKMSPSTAAKFQEIEARREPRDKMEQRAALEVRQELKDRYPDQANVIDAAQVKFTPETHRLLIERALRKGEPVPPEVLADYPDLQPKPVNQPPPESTTAAKRAGETTPVLGKEKERSFPKTLEASGREGGTDRAYPEFTDKDAEDRATQRIAKDPESARAFVLKGEPTLETPRGKDVVTTGIKLADQLTTEAENSSNKVEAATKHAQAIEILTHLSVLGTESGQTVQSFKYANRYTPEGAPLEVVRIAKKQGASPKPEDVSSVREMARKQTEFESQLADVQKQIEELQSKAKTTKTVTKPVSAVKTARTRLPSLVDRLTAMENEARANLNARTEKAQSEIKDGKGQRGTGVNPADIALSIADWTKIGAAKIAKGGLNFASWSKAMIDDFGDEIRPHLNKIFVAAHRLVGEQRATLKEESAVRGASKELKKRGQPITPKTIEDLRQERYELQAKKRQNTLDMDRKFRQLERSQTVSSKVTGVVSTVLRDGLLSFHGLFNILSGMSIKQAIDAAARIPEATLDIARVRGAQMLGKTVPRTSAGVSARGLTYTAKSLVTQGARNVGKALAGQPSEVMPHVHEGPFDSPYVNAAIGPMGRLYGAKEALIRSWALPSERFNQASVMAHNDVLDGVIKRKELNTRIDDYLNGRAEVSGVRNQKLVESLAKQAAGYEVRNKDIIPSAKDGRIKELTKDPTLLIDSLAKQYADKQVYADPSLVAEMVKGGQKGVARVSPAAGKAVDVAQSVVLPFVKRPSNAITDLLYTYTGARIPVEAVRNSFSRLGGEHWSPAEIKSFNQALARGGAGPAIFAFGFALGARGMLTSQNDKHNPGALKVGDNYYAIGRVPVIGWLLVSGATAQKDGGKAVPEAIARMIAEHPLLRGLKQGADAVSEGVQATSGKTKKAETAATSFAGKTLGRLVPTPIAAAAETMDTQQRDDRGLLGPATSRLPFLRQRLPTVGEKGRFSAFNPFKPPSIRLRARGKSSFKF